tara:strand:- start:163 stop:552 length:390 start_codon:yes stop_codon:yes gene_type:complete
MSAAVVQKVAALVLEEKLERLELTLNRGDDRSFGIELAHYEGGLFNIVTGTATEDSPLKVNDVIIAVGETTLDDRIDAHLPDDDAIKISVVRGFDPLELLKSGSRPSRSRSRRPRSRLMPRLRRRRPLR